MDNEWWRIAKKKKKKKQARHERYGEQIFNFWHWWIVVRNFPLAKPPSASESQPRGIDMTAIFGRSKHSNLFKVSEFNYVNICNLNFRGAFIINSTSHTLGGKEIRSTNETCGCDIAYRESSSFDRILRNKIFFQITSISVVFFPYTVKFITLNYTTQFELSL